MRARTPARRIFGSVVLWLAACSRDPAPPASDSTRDHAAPTPVAASSDAPPVRNDGTMLAESTLMGTRVTVNVWVGPERDAATAGAAIEAAFDEMARLEAIMSEWRPESPVSALNDHAGQDPIAIPAELYAVLERAHDISAATEGSFDVTFHGVGVLWSFDPGSRPPAREDIQARLPLVDWRGVELDPTHRTARLSRVGMKIGLGAIAKGYIVDAASRLLVDRGFADHIVEGGGDTYVSGTKAGRPWIVGIQDPDEQGAIGRLAAHDEAVVTSGNYERYFEFEGTRYAHIIDPRTGWPLPYDESPKSVTIVAANATDADAYATAVTVMGTERGRAFLESAADVEGVVIDAQGKVHVSSGLADRFQPMPTPAGGP